jgi:exosortase
VEAAVLGVLLSPLLLEWARTCAASSRLSHCLLVPILAAGLAWRSGPAPSGSTEGHRGRTLSTWTALLAAGLFVLGGTTGIFTLALLALPVTVVAWVGHAGGGRALRHHAGSLALLVLMVPPPMPLIDRATPHLVSLSGRTAVALLAPFDAEASWVGSTLGFRGWNLIVAEACSGTGTLLVLGVLGFFLAALFRLRPGRTAVVALAIVPLTLLVNGLRIASSALVIDAFGAQAGEGLAHELLGQVVVLGGAALLAWGVGRQSERTPAEARP